MKVTFPPIKKGSVCRFLRCSKCLDYIWAVLELGQVRMYKPYTYYFGEPLCMECYESEVSKGDFDRLKD